jgi:hypothetical protein
VSDAEFGFNVSTANGRAIQHILEQSSLAPHLGNGITVTWHGDSGRMLYVHESYTDWCGTGAATLLVLIESLAGSSKVVLANVFAVLDDANRKVAAEAMWLAAGYEYLGVAS